MSQVLHLLKKDLRAMRLPLAVFYLVLLVQSVIVLRDPLVHDRSPRVEVIAILLPVAILAIGGLLVQQEPLVGTTAFWATRPIRRGALLLSKAVFLFLFLMLPSVLATLGVLSSYGMRGGDLGAALGLSAVALAWLLVGAILVASVTQNIPAYVTAWICLLLGTTVLNSLLEQVVPPRMSAFTTSNSAVATPVYLSLGVLLILHQYFTRRTRRTVIGIAASYLAAPACGLLILLAANPPTEIQDLPFSDQVDVGLNATMPDGAFAADQSRGFETTFAATAEIPRMPRGLDAAVESLRGDVWIDGNAQAQVRGESTPVHFDRGGIEAAMPGFRWVAKPEASQIILSLKLRSGLTLEKLSATRAVLRATAGGELFAYRIAGTVPLNFGEKFESGSKAAILKNVARRQSSLQLALRTRQITVSGVERFPRILLINRRRDEMVEGDSRNASSTTRLVSFPGPTIHASELELNFPAAAQRSEVVLDEEWLRDAEIAFLDWEPRGRFRVPIELDDFRLASTDVESSARATR